MYYEIRFLYAFLIEEVGNWNMVNEIQIPKTGEHIWSWFIQFSFLVLIDEISRGLRENFIYRHSLPTNFFIHIVDSLKYKRDINYKEDGTYEFSAGNHTWKPSYKPFEGHVSKLGHYFRHLYQLIKFVAANNNLAFSFKEKYEYIKTNKNNKSSIIKP